MINDLDLRLLFESVLETAVDSIVIIDSRAGFSTSTRRQRPSWVIVVPKSQAKM